MVIIGLSAVPINHLPEFPKYKVQVLDPWTGEITETEIMVQNDGSMEIWWWGRWMDITRLLAISPLDPPATTLPTTTTESSSSSTTTSSQVSQPTSTSSSTPSQTPFGVNLIEVIAIFGLIAPFVGYRRRKSIK